MEILKQMESAPDSYPTVEGLSDEAADLDTDAIWQRIETYTAYRFVERDVVWTIEGVEDEAVTLPLTPVVSQSVEKWEGGAWVAVTLPDGPLGHVLPSDGVFRVTAQVGAEPVPPAVSEAFRRLAEYSVDMGKDSMLTGHPSHTDHTAEIGSSVRESYSRYATWAARAIQLSGAADLLRPYRRA